MKYVYNKTNIYTLLFKRGTIEIKPYSYYEAPEYEVEDGVFVDAQKSGQVDIFDKLEDVPIKPTPAPITVEAPDPFLGLTEEQLKTQPLVEPRAAGGKVTKLGGDESNSGLTESQLLAKQLAEKGELKTEASRSETTGPETTEPETTEPVKRGRKAKVVDTSTSDEVSANPGDPV